jgi:predicted DCC family thiol-disulfide oxidoreductase YuxK
MLYMKTLIDHTILYDDECPLCREYTNAFVKTGMLDQHGREAFTNVVNSNIPNIDWNRARNEIALINKKDNSVQYGIDSLMTILSNSMPGLKRLFRFKPFYFLMNQFYFFISYNRKAIAPAKFFEGNSTCAPDLNYTYRWAYIIFTWLVTSLILVQYSTLAFPLIPRSDFYREFLICGGQLVFQGVIVATIKRDRWIHYLGNVMTISFMGALALAPMFLLQGVIDAPWFYIGYFMMVVGFMFMEHIRRVKILELPGFVSATWALYRVLVLLIIL